MQEGASVSTALTCIARSGDRGMGWLDDLTIVSETTPYCGVASRAVTANRIGSQRRLRARPSARKSRAHAGPWLLCLQQSRELARGAAGRGRGGACRDRRLHVHHG